MAMFDSENTLLDYNNKGILGGLLAIEDHLSQLDASKINDSWCIKKHTTTITEHHLKEAINHSATISPEKSKQYKLFLKDFEKVMENPSIKEVRALRNRFRQVSGDHTLTTKCKLCDEDTYGIIISKLRKSTTKTFKEEKTNKREGIFPMIARLREGRPRVLNEKAKSE